jgi:hypothetical protein
MPRFLRSLQLVALVAPLSLVASTAWAHAHLLSSNPAKDATVAAPAAIHLEFSEGLEAKLSAATLMTAAGANVPVTTKVAGKAIDATPASKLAPGTYMVMWKVVSGDGHKMSGDYNFTVK